MNIFLDNLCMNIIKSYFLVMAIIAGGIAALIKDLDIGMEFDQAANSYWMLFHDFERMIPPEYLEIILACGKIFLVSNTVFWLWDIARTTIGI